MALTPHSTVYLLGTPLDNKYKNQIMFETQSAQYAYFHNLVKHSYSNMTYQRKNNVIRVEEHIDKLWDVNYVMYQNVDFTHKWFYAFIVKMEYVNEHTTDIYIETDVFQTWLFETEVKTSFVVREHVADDTIGKNLVDEQLELGEYKQTNFDPVNLMGSYINILATSDNSPLGVTAPVGNLYGDLVTGLTFFPFGNDDAGIQWLKQTIQTYATAGKSDAIVMIFTIPRLASPTLTQASTWNLGEPLHTGELTGYDTFTTTKHLSNLDGYTPKNNKMHTYPYKFLYMSNRGGQSAVFRYEDFSSTDMKFRLRSVVAPDTTVSITPLNYKGVEYNGENCLILRGFPLCSWTTDMFSQWFAQNKGSMLLGLGASTLGIVGGIATENPLAIAGGVMGIFGEMAQVNKALIQPDQARGQVGNGSLFYSTYELDFFYSHMTIKQQYAKRIDDFFTMFGYKVNALKVPELHSRQFWNYVKTIDVNIDGQIPDEDLIKLKSIYNNGITLWHNGNEGYFLNYTLDNYIR